MATDTVPDAPTKALLRNLITALEDKKAEQLKVLHVGAISNITDYLVLATGNSEPHLRALRIEAEKVLDAVKAPIAGMEQGGFGSGWTVVDAYQIMVHFFTAEQRENYALEKLWKDADEVDLKTMVAKAIPKAVPAAKTKVTKTKTAKSSNAKSAASKVKPAAKKSSAGNAKSKSPTHAEKLPTKVVKKTTTSRKSLHKTG
jgi:ribosome-associated protein